MKLIITTLFFFIFVLITTSCYSTEHYIEKGFFKIEKPPNWNIIPQEELEEFQKFISEYYKEKVTYDLALQLNSTNRWFAHPYILIQIDNKGRQYTKRQIESGIKKKNIKSSIDSKKQRYDKIIFNLNENDVFFDRKENILYTKFTIFEENSKIDGLLAQLFTNYGAIRVAFYDFEESYKENIATFYNFIENITIDPKKKYSVQNEKQTKKPDPLAKVISYGLLAALLAFVIMTLKIKK